MTPVSAISQQIWDMKYRFKTATGEPVDKTIEDTWRRVARALAGAEAGPDAPSADGPVDGPADGPENVPEAESNPWEARFFKALENFAFMPAGRILAGAGTGRNVTLFNCFVMGRIPDDMAGIFENLKEAALTLQQGGGIGYDFSTLRPKGAPVKGVGADASGPLSFMDVWDAMCRTVMSAGHRRGAMMATLRCDHPDIEAFIEAKQEPGRLRMFNLSVLVTDAFMQAVRADASWELGFGGATYRVVQARALWDSIMRATYAYAEPGVIFIDRVNRRNNLSYCEEIFSSNPCISGESWIYTVEGPRRVRDLLGSRISLLVDGQPHATGPEGFFETGRKPVFRLTTREGPSLRLTADHRVRRMLRISRDLWESEWAEAGNLMPGDKILLHDHGADQAWPGPYGENEGYLIGLLIGDGTLKVNAAVLSVWPGKLAVGGGVERPGVLPIMDRALAAANSLPHRADFAGWVDIAGRGEVRLSLSAIKRIAGELGLRPGNKAVTPNIEYTSSQFYRGFLGGFFDADGSVQGTQRKGVSIRLAQSNLENLEAVQRMLLRIGIVSRLYRNRRPARMAALPNGKGGTKDYWCAAQHELIVSKENVIRFKEAVGFTDSEKAGRLEKLIAAYKRRPNRERYFVTVDSIVSDGIEPVYDVHVPGVNAFDANGFFCS